MCSIHLVFGGYKRCATDTERICGENENQPQFKHNDCPCIQQKISFVPAISEIVGWEITTLLVVSPDTYSLLSWILYIRSEGVRRDRKCKGI